MRRYTLAALALTASVTLWAVDNYTVHSSTRSGFPRAVKRQLKRIGQKVKATNPHLQRPRPEVMPPKPPPAPKLTPLPAPEQAPTRAERFMRGAAKIMTTSWADNIFVWLPAISTDPNTGPTFGLLPVLVLSDPLTHHIRHLLAPSYTYNHLFGQTVTGRYYFYPTDDSQLFAIGSYSVHVNREAKLSYENNQFLEGHAWIRAETYYDVDGSLRFFGVGPSTHEGDEAGYTGRDKVFHTDIGLNFLEAMRLSTGLRYRRLKVGQTVVPDIAELNTRFPALANQSQQTTWVQEIHLLWDTRDFPVTPSKGQSGEIFFEKTTRGWGSDSDFIRYGLEGKQFFPWKNGNVTAIRGLYNWVNGPNIPFYELETLGGRETLRGYGEGRFNDKGRVLFNIEHRVKLTSVALMGVETRFEVGPFFDLGTVFPKWSAIRRRDFRSVFGGSFRAAVKPNVVGSVDVGVGKEGPGVYVGINYPF